MRLIACILGSVFMLAALCARPVRIASDAHSEIISLWAWQDGEIRFINSVTNRPVSIRFGMVWRFSGFTARTDPETESYYTAGAYSWNSRLSAERQSSLQWCSEVGISLRLGQRKFEIEHGCLKAALMWPP